MTDLRFGVAYKVTERRSADKNQARAPPGEVVEFLKESAALPWVPRKRGEGESKNPGPLFLTGRC
jgi:hypothetical protein